jgi:hypothetical protein
MVLSKLKESVRVNVTDSSVTEVWTFYLEVQVVWLSLLNN